MPSYCSITGATASVGKNTSRPIVILSARSARTQGVSRQPQEDKAKRMAFSLRGYGRERAIFFPDATGQGLNTRLTIRNKGGLGHVRISYGKQ